MKFSDGFCTNRDKAHILDTTSTGHNFCSQSNFVYGLSGLYMCWAKHFPITEPLACLSGGHEQLHLGTTERQRASVPVHMLCPLVLSGIMITV